MTHTIGKAHDKTWWLGCAEIVSDGVASKTSIRVMFTGLSFQSALRLVNTLNGGESISGLDSTSLRAWELCAHG